MKIALSFLGTSEYEETTYIVEGATYTSRFVQSVIRKHFLPQNHYVFVTKAARLKHEEGLLEEGFDKDELIDISDGKTEEELWDLFSRISETVPENAEVVFDVTHGFRIQPMLALAVIVYLRFQKQVSVKKICYGLFEKGAETNQILDVTPFLDIIDWSVAIRRLSEKGDAGDLADIMKKYHKQTYMNQDAYKAEKLANTGIALNDLMDNLSLVRPVDAATVAGRLVNFASDLKNDLDNISQTRPLTGIMDSLRKEVTGMAFSENLSGNEGLFTQEGMQIMLNMCDHYIKVGKYQQCLTLATELLIGAAALLHNQDPLQKTVRNSVSYRLNALEKKELIGPVYDWEKSAATMLRIVAEARNDVNHAGIRKDPQNAKSLKNNAVKTVSDIRAFLKNHDLLPSANRTDQQRY